MRFIESDDLFERNLMVHMADEILHRRELEREDQAQRIINTLGEAMKRGKG
jgi:hypothetical protein